jgi:Pyridoxine 5'-phosphate oxidase C-terminal dimerisation region
MRFSGASSTDILRPYRLKAGHLRTPCRLYAIVNGWEEAPDRLHNRWLYERDSAGAWRISQLAP